MELNKFVTKITGLYITAKMINVLNMIKDFRFYVIILLFLLSCQSSDINNNSNNENQSLYISSIDDQTISMNSILGPLVFTISDLESDPDSLDLYVTSMNQYLVDKIGRASCRERV